MRSTTGVRSSSTRWRRRRATSSSLGRACRTIPRTRRRRSRSSQSSRGTIPKSRRTSSPTVTDVDAGGWLEAATLLVGLLVVVAALVTIAGRIRVSYPILLLVGGLALGLLPLPRIELDPEIVFLLVLPPLLYVSAFFTPVRDFKANLSHITSLAVGLVLASTAAVAAVAMLLVPGMSWPLAVALGAIVSPPDAVAASAVAERLAVPRRIVSILEGESLLNDATALP